METMNYQNGGEVTRREFNRLRVGFWMLAAGHVMFAGLIAAWLYYQWFYVG